MNCSDFEKAVVAIARRDLADAAGTAHAKECTRCARRLAKEKTLSAAMAATAAEDAELTAPAEVEQALIAAFRERQAASPPRRRWWIRVAVAAIAAGLVVAGVVSLYRAPAPHQAQVQAPTKFALVPPVSVTTAVASEAQPRHVKTLRLARPSKAGQPKDQLVTARRERVTDFIPIIYDPEPIERGQIVRVRLPRSALAAFGLPLNEEHAEEPIRADVVLGEDGIARAVRFVK